MAVDRKIKKVKPYPFPAVLENNGVKHNVEVLLLTQLGFIARTQPAIVQVGQFTSFGFELPVSKQPLAGRVRVIKTYDRAIEGEEKKVERLAEFHFDGPTAQQNALIQRFMIQIGQK